MCEGENDGKSEHCSVREADPLMRRGLALAALVVPSLLGAGIAAPAALAADDCPNAAVRAQQSAARLPNCLAYERVSPADKNGAAPILDAVTDDGDRVLFSLNSGIADPLSFLAGKYSATRTADGWATNALMPPTDLRYPKGTEIQSQVGWSTDLQRVLLSTQYPLNENDRGTQANGNGSRDLYLREADGSYTWVVPDPSVVDNNTALTVDFMRGSADMRRIVVSTARQFDPRVTTTDVSHIYVWTPDGMRLASVLPDGSLPESLPMNFGGSFGGPRAVSADGRRIAFTVTDTTARIYVRLNADDPATAVTREAAVGPNGETCTSATLSGLSDDGTKLVFWCANALIAGAPTDGGLYLRDLDGGPSAVRYAGAASGFAASIIGATADFSRVYIRASARASLIQGGEPAVPVIEPLSGSDPLRFTHVSRNGKYLAFQSTNDFGFDRGGSGSSQVYRYAAETDELTCVSCRPDGSPTTGSAGITETTSTALERGITNNAVTEDGAVVFTTDTGLDPQDTNGVSDAYAWLDGRLVLLTDGRNREPSRSSGATPDGRTFFVETAASLAADDLDGGGYDLYAARPDGGWLVPDAPAVCTANCQAASPARPSVPGIGSADVVGRGNLLEPATAPTKRATVALTAAAKLTGSRVTVRVTVSGAGSIRVSGSGLRQATVKAKKAGTSSVTVRLSAYGLAQQRRRGRLATRASVRFAPASGASVKAGRSLTVVAATKKGGR